MNSLIHAPGCMCAECQAWFSAMNDAKVSGLCERCHRPIDDHQKNHKGLVVSCG